MQFELPKTNSEYKAILNDYWGIEIDNDEIIGTYSLHKNGTQGFLLNCTTLDGKKLKYPDDNRQLFILIWANPLKNLTHGAKYKFKVQFAALDKRIQLNPFLLVTQRDCLIKADDANQIGKNNYINDLNTSKGK